MVHFIYIYKEGRNFCFLGLFFSNVHAVLRPRSVCVHSLLFHLFVLEECWWTSCAGQALLLLLTAVSILCHVIELPSPLASLAIIVLVKKSYTTYYGMTQGHYGTERSHKDNLATIYQSAEKISFVSGHVTNVAVKCFKSSYITGI